MSARGPSAQAERPMGETRVRFAKLMLPNDANPHGNVHGGVIMKHVDEVAGLVAHRHARRSVVTARLHTMDFLQPVFVGNMIILTGVLAYTGRSSMEVQVRIEAEDLDTGDVVHTGTAWLTMIALDERRRSVEVPRVLPETEAEKVLFEEARRKYDERKKEMIGRRAGR